MKPTSGILQQNLCTNRYFSAVSERGRKALREDKISARFFISADKKTVLFDTERKTKSLTFKIAKKTRKTVKRA